MFYLLKVFFKDLWMMVPLAVAALAEVFMWAYVFISIRPSGEQFFLHYNIIFGVDLVGEWWKILYLPLGGLLIILVNFTLAVLLYNTDRVLARLLAAFAGVFELFLVWAVYLIVNINL
ncbi:MAG: hypothetical protein PHD72_00150 [Patescibacteria group bacterium]|nr:hypothetical protein [Patescibacteria group bacterium]